MDIDKLDDIDNSYNSTYHITIKMKSVDVKSNKSIDSSKEINNEHPKFKISDIARISKFKNVFVKDYVPNWFDEVFLIKKVKNAVWWTYVIIDLKCEKKGFAKKNYKKRIEKTLELKK